MSKDIDKGVRPGPVTNVAGGKASRRGFLLGAGAAAGVAGVVAVALKPPAQPVAAVAAPEADKAPAVSRGYHETAHIRRYYETTKV